MEWNGLMLVFAVKLSFFFLQQTHESVCPVCAVLSLFICATTSLPWYTYRVTYIIVSHLVELLWAAANGRRRRNMRLRFDTEVAIVEKAKRCVNTELHELSHSFGPFGSGVFPRKTAPREKQATVANGNDNGHTWNPLNHRHQFCFPLNCREQHMQPFMCLRNQNMLRGGQAIHNL